MPNPMSLAISFEGVEYDRGSNAWHVRFEIVANSFGVPFTVPVRGDTEDEKIVAVAKATLHAILQQAAQETRAWAAP